MAHDQDQDRLLSLEAKLDALDYRTTPSKALALSSRPSLRSVSSIGAGALDSVPDRPSWMASWPVPKPASSSSPPHAGDNVRVEVDPRSPARILTLKPFSPQQSGDWAHGDGGQPQEQANGAPGAISNGHVRSEASSIMEQISAVFENGRNDEDDFVGNGDSDQGGGGGAVPASLVPPSLSSQSNSIAASDLDYINNTMGPRKQPNLDLSQDGITDWDAVSIDAGAGKELGAPTPALGLEDPFLSRLRDRLEALDEMNQRLTSKDAQRAHEKGSTAQTPALPAQEGGYISAAVSAAAAATPRSLAFPSAFDERRDLSYSGITPRVLSATDLEPGSSRRKHEPHASDSSMLFNSMRQDRSATRGESATISNGLWQGNGNAAFAADDLGWSLHMGDSQARGADEWRSRAPGAGASQGSTGSAAKDADSRAGSGSSGKDKSLLKLKLVLEADYDILVPRSKGLQTSLKMRLAAAIAEAALVDKDRVKVLLQAVTVSGILSVCGHATKLRPELQVEALARGSVIVDATINLSPDTKSRAHEGALASFFSNSPPAASAPRHLDADTVFSNLHDAIKKGGGPLTQVFCAAAVSREGHAPPPGARSSGASGAPPSAAAEIHAGPELETPKNGSADTGKTQRSAGGILEIFVMEARHLPTQEYTQAFCTLELEASSYSASQTGTISILKNVDAVTSRGLKSSLDPEPDAAHKGAPRGHVHRTHIAGGSADPSWQRGFQFGVSRPTSNDRLRVQVLHKAAVGTEFIGAVTVEVRTIIDRLADLQAQSAPGNPNGNQGSPAAKTAGSHSPSSKHGLDGGTLRGKWEQAALPDSERSDQFHSKRQRQEEVWCTWMPLRNVVGERARGPSGGDSEVKLGFRWTQPSPPGITTIQGLLQEPLQGLEAAAGEPSTQWSSGRFVLDGAEQILWMRESGGGIGRKCNVRFAIVRDETDALGPCVFSVECASGSRFVGRALDDEDFARWLNALKASSGLTEEGDPDPRPSFVERYRWQLMCFAIMCITLTVTLPVLFLVLLAPSPPPLFVNASWGTCKASPSAQLADIPADMLPRMSLSSEGDLLWCVGCECFSRCIFGSSGGLLVMEPVRLFRACSQACECVLPPPDSGCGNGIVANRTVDWFGQALAFEEECDDGNTASGDGCDGWCRIEEFMMTDAPGCNFITYHCCR